MSNFPYGEYLRTSHALGAVKDRHFPGRVRAVLTHPLGDEEFGLFNSGSYAPYVPAIRDEYQPEFLGRNSIEHPIAQGANSWAEFAKLATGHKAPSHW